MHMMCCGDCCKSHVVIRVCRLECPKVHGKVTQLLCPSRRRHGYHVCIDETALCNGRPDCPYGEDEDAVNCLFYKTVITFFSFVAPTAGRLVFTVHCTMQTDRLVPPAQTTLRYFRLSIDKDYARLGSARLGSARLGSARLGSARL
ncbi:unnamed protein product, partial [Soboliphyme baturini]|uniref:ZP domain-containing protein n=1 Tax=Soboliphyme baturini TaxID=241478 RepID=A0A183IYL9_9BILA